MEGIWGAAGGRDESPPQSLPFSVGALFFYGSSGSLPKMILIFVETIMCFKVVYGSFTNHPVVFSIAVPNATDACSKLLRQLTASTADLQLL